MVAEVVIERGCIQATLTWEIVSESMKKHSNVTLACDDDTQKATLCEYSSFVSN